ncbi:TolC family outer membrane protein [Endozoicomonas arenosclerae]|uniref:TolC family outer membrane protein n=1 Tax=Endozoicomonas arenosclerae TaxID=1633495 RepID=UPI0007850E46|nr:TolC family outer membrane protein [Endozoicomonas arenosclerae]
MPRTYRKGFLLAALAGSILSAHAAETEYNLLDVYNLALKNDAQLAAARADMMVTQEGSSQARALLLPNLSLTGGTQYNKTKSETTGGDLKDSYNSNTWGASLNQPLFNMASWFGYDSAKFQSSQAEATFGFEQQNLILRVSEAYFNVLRAEDSLITSIAEEKAVKQQLDQARERYNVGLIAETDVLEARARYDSARVTRIEGENNLSVSYEALRTITDMDIQDIGKLKKTMPVSAPTPANSDQWVNNALKSNLQLEAARESLKAAESNIKVKKSGHAPTVDAFASYNYSSSNADSARTPTTNPETGLPVSMTGDGDQTVVGVKFTLPLFAGGGTSSQVRQATYQMESVQQNYDKALREINSGTRNLFRTVNSDVSRVEARCQGIVSSESALKATQSGYEVGTRNITDVLDAQKTLFAAQRDYLNARYDFIVNTLKLKQTAGTLSPEDLSELNGWIVSSEEMSIPAQCRAD